MAAGSSLALLALPSLFLPALHRDAPRDVSGDGLVHTSSKCSDFGEERSNEARDKHGKALSMLHGWNKNKFPRAPDRRGRAVMWCPVS